MSPARSTPSPPAGSTTKVGSPALRRISTSFSRTSPEPTTTSGPSSVIGRTQSSRRRMLSGEPAATRIDPGCRLSSAPGGECRESSFHWPTIWVPVRARSSLPARLCPARGLPSWTRISATSSRWPRGSTPATRGPMRALARTARTAARAWFGVKAALAPASIIGARRLGSSMRATIVPRNPCSRAPRAKRALRSSSPLATRARAPASRLRSSSSSAREACTTRSPWASSRRATDSSSSITTAGLPRLRSSSIRPSTSGPNP